MQENPTQIQSLVCPTCNNQVGDISKYPQALQMILAPLWEGITVACDAAAKNGCGAWALCFNCATILEVFTICPERSTLILPNLNSWSLAMRDAEFLELLKSAQHLIACTKRLRSEPDSVISRLQDMFRRLKS